MSGSRLMAVILGVSEYLVASLLVAQFMSFRIGRLTLERTMSAFMLIGDIIALKTT